MKDKLISKKENVYELPKEGKMNVPGRIYSSESLLSHPGMDSAIQQVANVAELPGIVDASMAMPDIHWGYGFPIGGVAAFKTTSSNEKSGSNKTFLIDFENKQRSGVASQIHRTSRF